MSADLPEPARRGLASLRDSLELVLPTLPAELVSAAAIPWLRAVASVLPPVHRAGFECRLADTEHQVDLQQGIFASDGEPAQLANFLAQAGPANDAWAAVHRVAERWSTPDDLLHGAIDELWLELDAAPVDGGAALALGDVRPSVFAVLERAGADSVSIARELVRVLVSGEESAVLGRALTRCSLACSKSARVSHVGVMLGRSLSAMRVHVRGLPVREFKRYLSRIGWAGEQEEIAALAQVLLDYGDWVVVCLDILGDQIMRVGLECFFAAKRGLDPRWRPLLERLRVLGLSSADKAAALLQWPATFTPLNSPGPWPEDLIARSLTEPEDALGAFDRRLSHVKLTFVPGQRVTAKAYFGYGHVWMRGQPAPEAVAAPALRAATTVDHAVEAAVDWLLAARHQGGWWRDFAATPAVGFSDEWVTAYVGDALARAVSAPGPRRGYRCTRVAADATPWRGRMGLQRPASGRWRCDNVGAEAGPVDWKQQASTVRGCASRALRADDHGRRGHELPGERGSRGRSHGARWGVLRRVDQRPPVHHRARGAPRPRSVHHQVPSSVTKQRRLLVELLVAG